MPIRRLHGPTLARCTLVRDSSVSHECDVQGGLARRARWGGKRRRSPRPPAPAAAIYRPPAPAAPRAHHVCCSLARSGGATINKCSGPGVGVACTPLSEQLSPRSRRCLPYCQLLGGRLGKTRLFLLTSLEPPGHATGVQRRYCCPLSPPRALPKDVGDKEFQIMTIRRRI